MLKLHHHKDAGIYSLRRTDRSTTWATPRNCKAPRFLGHAIALSHTVHVLLTPSEFAQARAGKRPVCETHVTSWPRVKLFIKRIKEMTK